MPNDFEERRAKMKAALDAIPGLTFGDVTLYFSAKQTERDAKIAQMAREEYQRDGECEIDSYDVGEAIVSEGDDNGAYVMAWVWVDFAETELDKEREDVPDADALRTYQFDVPRGHTTKWVAALDEKLARAYAASQGWKQCGGEIYNPSYTEDMLSNGGDGIDRVIDSGGVVWKIAYRSTPGGGITSEYSVEVAHG